MGSTSRPHRGRATWTAFACTQVFLLIAVLGTPVTAFASQTTGDRSAPVTGPATLAPAAATTSDATARTGVLDAVVGSLIADSGVTFNADPNNGDGTMTVSPSVAAASASNQRFVFTFTDNGASAFANGSVVTVVVPSGWTAPTNTAGAAGLLSVANVSGTCTPSTPTISGTGPWTVTVALAAGCTVNGSFKLNYGGQTVATNVTSPAAGSYTFTTASQNDSIGSPVALTAGSPSIVVSAGKFWTGSLSTLWATTGNWSSGAVPVAGNNIVIPSGTPFSPTFSSSTTSASFGNLEIQSGATMTVDASIGTSAITMSATSVLTVDAGGTLNVPAGQINPKGALVVNGTLNASGGGIYPQAAVSGVATHVVEINGRVNVSGTVASFGDTSNSTRTLSINAGGTLEIDNAYTFNSFTYTISPTSTVIYGGTAQTVIAPSAITGAPSSYGNLTLGGSGTKTMPGSAMTVSGNFTTSGTASATAGGALTVGGNFVLGSGTTFGAGTFTHNVAGNFVNNGATFTAGSSTVNMTGAGKSIGGTSATTFNNLTIGGTTVSLSGVNTTVGATLALGANRLITGSANKVIVTSTTQPTATTGYVDGALQRPASASSPIAFAVGNGTNSTPVSVTTSASGTGNLTVRSVAGEDPNSGSAIDQTHDVNTYFVLTPSGTVNISGATFNYPAANIDAGSTASGFHVQRFLASTWNEVTVSGTPTTTATSVTGLTSAGLGDFVIGAEGLGQTITFTSTAPSAAMPGGDTYTPTASATSGLTVTFTIDATAGAVCSISAGVVSFIGGGTCVIDANQAGDSTWAVAPQVQQSFAVGKADQTISFGALSDATYGAAPFTVSATASSGLAVTFSTTTGSVCTSGGTNGATITIRSVGTCTVQAAQAGNPIYNPAPPVQQSFTVGQATLTITASSDPMTYGGTVPTISPSYSGLVAGDTAASLTTAPTCSTTATATSPVGPYDSSCSGAVDANYVIGYLTGTTTVGTRTIAVTPDASQGKTAGDVDPALTYHMAGTLVGADAFTGSLSRDPGEAAGTYAILQGSLALSSNYNLVFITGVNFTVNPAAATTLVVSGIVSPRTAGTAGSVTVTAKDAFGNVATGYNGTVTFTSSDSAAVLPANHTFTALEAGVATLGVTLKTAGTQSVTATDTVTGSITGTQSGIFVNPTTATWSLYYYSGEDGPFIMPATPAPGTIAQFAFSADPDQALLMSNVGGNLLGQTVSSTIKIDAAPGTTFVGYDPGSTPPTVRFYFHTTNLALGESAYWWSNPVSIPLATLFADGPAGATLSVSLDPANWSDRLGVFGNSDAAHLAAFDTSASNVTQIGLSFGSGDTFAFGDGSIPGGALFDMLQFQITSSAATTIVVSGIASPLTAGDPGSVTVTAKDAFGNVATGYTGTVHFTSTDSAAVLPADHTFTGSDAGVATLGVTLKTAGTQSVTATDTATGSITSTQSGIVVNPAAAATLVVSGIGSPRTAGTAGSVTVTAKDAFGNVATGYTGTVTFTSSDPAAVLPADHTFTALEAGVATLGVTLDTAGTRSVTATDTVTGSITGTQSGIVVTSSAAATLVVSGIVSPRTAGTAGSVTVTAKDAFGNVATGYTGTVTFTSSDSAAVLPANHTFTALEAGVATLSVTLKTAGTSSVTATDTVTGSITGTQSDIFVNPAAAAILVVSGIGSPRAAGDPGSVTVTAKDAFGNVATGYTGTVHFTSTDAAAVLPANYTFAGSDAGVATLGVTLKTVGTRSVTATDTATGSITGTQSGIVVNPAAAATLVVSGIVSPRTAGTAGSVTVTAKDAFGNVATGYTGTVTFTSSDPAAVLPADYTFAGSDAGVATLSVTLKTAGTSSVTATDTATGSITGTQSGIVVTSSAAATLVVSGIVSPRTAGTAGSVTVTAKDAFGNVATGYTGTVTFTSSDSAAVLPANHTFTALEAGVATLGVTLKTAGTQSVTATDTVTGSITGTQSGIFVNPTTATWSLYYYSGEDGPFIMPATPAPGTIAQFAFSADPDQALLMSNVGGNLLGQTVSSTIKIDAAPGTTFVGYDPGSTPPTVRFYFHTTNLALGESAYWWSNPVSIPLATLFADGPSGATLSVSLDPANWSDRLGVFGNSDAAHLAAFDTSASNVTQIGLSFGSGDTFAFGDGSNPGGALFDMLQFQITSSAATTIVVSGIASPLTAGDPGSVTVTAKDAFGNVATGYTGTVHFTSTDSAAVLPADHTFTGSDAGVATLGVTLKTAGTQSVTATDTATGSITSTQSGIVVNPAAAATLVVSGIGSPRTAGTAGSVTVTAKDAFGNVATGYTGTVTFTSSDPAAVLPADHTFTALEAGVATLGVTLDTAGTRSVTATDTVTGSITGTQSGIVVTSSAAATLVVSGIVSPRTAGTAGSVTVTAKDAFGNVATGYTGTVTFTSSDSAAVLPANHTFTALEAGVATLSVTLKTAGTSSVTATDTVTGSITGTQSDIFVNPAAAAILVVSGIGSPRAAGDPGSVTVTAKDAFGNVATGYTGTVHFTSTDAAAVLPANYTFAGSDAGVATLGVTLKTVGTRSVTATDTATGSITGTQSGIVVNPAAAATLVVSGIVSPRTAGTAGSVTVTAKDAFGNVATGYTGTVTFTSSDPAAVLPADYTFAGSDAGVATLSVTLKTAGTSSVTATDTATGSITGTQSGIVVTSSAAATLVVSGIVSPRTAGTAGSVTVTAKDAFGNVATGYRGTVHFTSTDSAAVLPANHTFTALEAGVATLGVTLKTAGTQSVTATDTATGSITGTQSGIVVNPAAAATLVVSGIGSPRAAGDPGSVTVTAKDAFGNVATGYTGTVHFTSSDSAAVLPADYTFAGSDAGVATFSVTLDTAGTQSVTATDTATGSITGTQSGIVVTCSLSGTFFAGGLPQTGGTVSLFDASTANLLGSSAVDAFGNYSFNNVPAGSYKLSLIPVTAGYGPQWYGSKYWAGATVIVLSSNTTVNISLTPAAYNVSGNLTAGGVPESGGGTVSLFTSAGSYVGSAPVNGSGNYNFGLVATGSYKLYFGSSPSDHVICIGIWIDPPGWCIGYQVPNQWIGGTDLASATPVTVSSADVTADFALAASATSSLSGSFTADGTAQAGASVYEFDTSGNYIGSATADGSGNYVSYLPVGSYKLYVVPTSPGYAAQWFGSTDGSFSTAAIVVVATTPTTANIALTGVYTVSGNLTAGGVPESGGGTVSLFTSAGTYVGSSAVDASGNYVSYLPAGSYKLYVASSTAHVICIGIWIDPPGWCIGYQVPNQWIGGTDMASATTVTVSSADVTANFALAASATSSLSGSFTAGGTAQAGATVYEFDPSGNYIGSATADGSGNYVSYLPVGSYELYVVPTSPGYAAQWFGSTDGSFSTAATVVVAITPTTANIALAGVYTVSGNLTAGGVPESGGGTVSLFTSAGSYVGSSAVDASGNYSFSYLPAADYKLYFGQTSAIGHAVCIGIWVENPPIPGVCFGVVVNNQWIGGTDMASATTVTVSSADVTANFALAASATSSLSGSFTAGGTAQAGATVYEFDPSGNYIGSATADGSGNYVSYLPVGSYKLYVVPTSPGYAAQWFGSTDGSFSTAATVVVAITPTTANIALAGVYTVSGNLTAGGVPESGGGTVSLFTSAGSYVGSSAVDASGNYSFSYLPAADYKLYFASSTAHVICIGIWIDPPGRCIGLLIPNQWIGGADMASATTVTVSSADVTANFALAASATSSLSGSFTAGGTAQAGATVYEFDPSGNYIGSATADGSGNYVSYLPVGSYELYVVPTSPGYAAQWFDSTDGSFSTAATVVVAITPTTANIALAGVYTLSGSFTAGGAPQTGGYVYAFNAGGSYVGSSAVDGTGKYNFGYLPAGSYKFYLSPVNPSYAMQWFGGVDFAHARTVVLSANSIFNIAL